MSRSLFECTRFKFGCNACNKKMYIYFEKGRRGGITYISNRYSRPIKKYLKYSKQEMKHIMNLGTNN